MTQAETQGSGPYWAGSLLSCVLKTQSAIIRASLLTQTITLHEGMTMTAYENNYYNRICRQEPGLTARVLQIASDHNVTAAGLSERIKSRKSLSEKLNDRKHPEQIEDQYDILRYTYVIDPKDYTEITNEIMDEFENEGMTIDRIKNFWLNPPEQYHGIHMQAETASGVRFEVQFHTPESYRQKEAAHDSYKRAMAKTASRNERAAAGRRQKSIFRTAKIPPEAETILEFARKEVRLTDRERYEISDLFDREFTKMQQELLSGHSLEREQNFVR